MASKIKLPPGWERCRTGIRGARKWRNMRLGCWVTERDGDSQLHCGLHHTPIKKDRADFTAQQAINDLHAVATDYEEKTGVVVNFAGSN